MKDIRAISEAQRRAFSRGEVPGAETVGQGVLAVPLAMPGSRIPFSLCYLVDGGDGELHLVDSGLDGDANWTVLRGAAARLGRGVEDIASVTVTHLHADHAQLAQRVRSASGAVVRMHERDAHALRTRAPFMPDEACAAALEAWGVPEERRSALRAVAARPVTASFELDVDEALRGGELLAAGSRELRVVHVPGHTAGHIAVVSERDRLVFAGDHVLPVINPGIGLGGRTVGDNPLADYLRSLEALGAYDAFEVWPGHGFGFRGLRARRDAIAQHHGHRADEVREVLRSEPRATVWEVASRLTWSLGWHGLDDFTLFSALGQTAMHVGRVV